MALRDLASMPAHAIGALTGAKSFRDNRIVGSPALNRRGFHLRRVALAERVAEHRRRRIERLASPAHRKMFDECGYVVVENALPDTLFATVASEVAATPFPARELRQGDTVTRFITLSPGILRAVPGIAQAVRHPGFQGLMRYVGAANGDPLVSLHTVLTGPVGGRPDPQSSFHSDTFHATAKGWLFLRDVAPEDGPFSYVPGSHRVTPARRDWEYEQSLLAAEHPDPHHASGSFRASTDELAAMGYPPAVTFPVKANTFVVADTHGFHARQPSRRASARLALMGSLRASPFLPLAGPDPMDLPGLRHRKAQILDAARAVEARLRGTPENQPFVGKLLADAPAVR